jgi:hypothetical protein
MQLIHTPEAQFFVTPQVEGDRQRQPMLGFFMSSGTGLLARRPLPEQKTIASQFMCKVDDRHNRILRKLRPFLFSNGDDLFEGMEGIPTHDDHLVLSHLVLPAIDLVVDFDILVALIRRYPNVLGDNEAALAEARNDVFQAIKSVKNAARSLNSGRLLEDRPDK